MATFSQSTFNFDLSTDANYRAVWGAVDVQLQGLGGWTYVAQTGDGDPSTASTGSAGTYPTFRVYKTTCAGQDWFMRLDYGHTAAGPSIKIQLGTTVNGSGTLGGQTSTQQTLACRSNPGAGSTVAISQATGRWTLGLGLMASNSAMFGMHADVDAVGAVTNTGIAYWLVNSSSGGTYQRVPLTGTIPAAGLWVYAAPHGANLVVGSHTLIPHVVSYDETGMQRPTPGVAVVGTSDFAAGVIVPNLSMYGSNRSYLTGENTNMAGNNDSTRHAFLFD